MPIRLEAKLPGGRKVVCAAGKESAAADSTRLVCRPAGFEGGTQPHHRTHRARAVDDASVGRPAGRRRQGARQGVGNLIRRTWNARRLVFVDGCACGMVDLAICRPPMSIRSMARARRRVIAWLMHWQGGAGRGARVLGELNHSADARRRRHSRRQRRGQRERSGDPSGFAANRRQASRFTVFCSPLLVVSEQGRASS